MPKNFERFPFDPSRVPFFYGYAVVGFSMLGMLVSIPGQTMGVSAFTDHLIEGLDISRTDLTTAYMIGTVSSSLILTWAGKAYDRLGARIMAVAASVGLGAILLLLSASPLIVHGIQQLIPWLQPALLAVVVMSVGFFLLRFFGQGILTMTSRNMLMQWFERRRGLANGACSVVVSFGFSYSPRLLDLMIRHFTWQGAWRVLGLAIAGGFALFAFVFFRDTPEGCGMLPDGAPADSPEHVPAKGHAVREFSLAEARGTFSFWVFMAALALLGLYYTAFTFHVASIFEEAGRTRGEAFAVFFPASVISVTVSFIAGWASDRIKLKYLLMVMLSGSVVSMASLCVIAHPFARYALIAGNGLFLGHFGLLGGVTWPTFFGRRHLGAISGFCMAATVFGSAVGPWLFSRSLDVTASYDAASVLCIGIAAALLLCAVRADNPQERLRSENG